MNYIQLFRATMPETVLETAALIVLVIDLGFFRKSTSATRATVAAFLGVLGCALALYTLAFAGPFVAGAEVLLTAGGSATVAQCAILILTALTLFLLIDNEFTRNPGEYVAVLLMSAAGGLIISAAQDLL